MNVSVFVRVSVHGFVRWSVSFSFYLSPFSLCFCLYLSVCFAFNLFLSLAISLSFTFALIFTSLSLPLSFISSPIFTHQPPLYRNSLLSFPPAWLTRPIAFGLFAFPLSFSNVYPSSPQCPGYDNTLMVDHSILNATQVTLRSTLYISSFWPWINRDLWRSVGGWQRLDLVKGDYGVVRRCMQAGVVVFGGVQLGLRARCV